MVEIQGETLDAKPAKKTKSLRQLVLIALLVVVLTAFLYDKYVLIPSADKKINQIISEVATSLNDRNREEVNTIANRTPFDTFSYRGLDIEQYRFPRGLPFYPRPVLDIAYQGNAIAFFSQEPMTEKYIDSKLQKITIDNSRASERKNLKASQGN